MVILLALVALVAFVAAEAGVDGSTAMVGAVAAIAFVAGTVESLARDRRVQSGTDRTHDFADARRKLGWAFFIYGTAVVAFAAVWGLSGTSNGFLGSVHYSSGCPSPRY